MSTATQSTQLRKGTKSCSECRRRKVRCTWTSEEAQACRRCEERGSICVPQNANKQAEAGRRLSSKHRILRLESKVNQLSNFVSDLQAKLECNPTPPLAIPSAQNDTMDDMHDTEDDEEDGSSASEFVTEDRPSHLYSLFQNDLLSIDTEETVREMHERSSKAAAVPSAEARSVLQRLMPDKADIHAISGHISRWYRIQHDIFPLTSLPKSQQDLLASYDTVSQPQTDTMALAAWLLGVASVSQLVPQEALSPDSVAKSFQKRFNFARMVSEAVETHILSHDSLIATVQGIEVALLSLRTQMSWVHMHKIWLNLRRVIAVAEMIGLPRAAKMVEMQDNLNTPPNQTVYIKASLWTSICSVERIACLLHNFPTATLRCSSAANQPLTIDGIVQPRVYMLRLSNIAAKIQDVDDLSMGGASEPEVYAVVLQLDNELRLLANEAPGEWWTALPGELSTAHLLQFLHSVMLMRTHLFFTMRRSPQGAYLYSQQAGLEACREVAERWRIIRRALPLGFFTSRIIDLQAFTATIVLLLTSESAGATYESELGSNRIRLRECVAQTVGLLREKAKDPVGSDVAREAVRAIQSLTAMLEHKGDSLGADGYLKLTVPRLGKIHVRCNPDSIRKRSATARIAQQQLRQSQVWQSAAGSVVQNEAMANFPFAMNEMQTQDLWNQDPFSWFIEDDYSGMFGESLMDPNVGMWSEQ